MHWVGPETDKYRLSVSGFSGDEGDAIAAPVNSMRVANGMQFSCFGADNDQKGSGLCSDGHGGWWFKLCTRSLLNPGSRRLECSHRCGQQ